MYIFIGYPDGEESAWNAGAVDWVCLVGLSHSNRCEMISHCEFDFLFSDDCCCENNFSRIWCPLCAFFVLIPFLFYFLVMSHMSSSRILHINPFIWPWWLRPPTNPAMQETQVPGLGRSLENGETCCLGKYMDRGGLQSHGVTESWTQLR